MFSTLRFLINRLYFTIPVIALIVLVLTTHPAPKKIHRNPWAPAGADSDTADGAASDDGNAGDGAASDGAAGAASSAQ